MRISFERLTHGFALPCVNLFATDARSERYARLAFGSKSKKIRSFEAVVPYAIPNLIAACAVQVSFGREQLKLFNRPIHSLRKVQIFFSKVFEWTTLSINDHFHRDRCEPLQKWSLIPKDLKLAHSPAVKSLFNSVFGQIVASIVIDNLCFPAKFFEKTLRCIRLEARTIVGHRM